MSECKRFIDFHTHQTAFSSEVLRLNSFSITEILNFKTETEILNPFTVGVHPWDSIKAKDMDFKTLLSPFIKKTNFIGLGEMGLDRACDVDFDLQLQVFTDQVLWAKEQSIDFLVLHCVRAQSDILHVLKSCQYQGQVLFHDYNGTIEDWSQLKDKGYIISLGKKILNPKTKAARLVESGLRANWPWGLVFLETDDHSIDLLFELYEFLSKRLSLSLEEVKSRFESSLPKGMQKL